MDKIEAEKMRSLHLGVERGGSRHNVCRWVGEMWEQGGGGGRGKMWWRRSRRSKMRVAYEPYTQGLPGPVDEHSASPETGSQAGGDEEEGGGRAAGAGGGAGGGVGG